MIRVIHFDHKLFIKVERLELLMNLVVIELRVESEFNISVS